MSTRIDDILDFWFGRIEKTVLPSANRSKIWFANDVAVDADIAAKFSEDLRNIKRNQNVDWAETPRGSLALIVVLDQFSRNIYRGKPEAFEQDPMALNLCLHGIERQFDHKLSLIERAFYYMPMVHTESLEMQLTSVRAFRILVELSFPEARPTFESFLRHAISHYEEIKQFGRFPRRNEALNRQSTEQEVKFLQEQRQGND